MSPLVRGLIATLGLVSSSLAVSQSGPPVEPQHTEDVACAAFTGKTVTPTSIDAGEFETSAQYEARMVAAGQMAPSTIVVPIPLDTKYISFDADAGEYAIHSYAIDNRNASWDIVFGTPNAPWPRPIPHRGFVDLVVRSAETVTRTYAAGNAYSAKTTVSVVERDTVV